ncbi:uncharacterized protein LOC18425541 isoform X1 [Amborella trichopoda]|uniref:IST1-like protein n=1 Tax=Amborella trichopoda TaxID=13333 RepID=W1NNU1_AMBTC|nr:uncharacterized protein LOC18425541 isoform X1 [Amborella trichopoda]ERM97556.1 hypothetical protein AMTR_s00200p00021070 [Amborella trichopoda]|eukprot:XP_020517714.1 uncharacterized protein LOC18425541 isoform X1 [Amborella trichopoda]
MLDSIFGRGFSGKCKSAIKQIKARIDFIKKRRNAELKILRGDVADFLTKGQDLNAFKRVEILIKEQNVTCGYEMVEHFGESILSQLSNLQKQRECTPECKEAVSSLAFAAARFSDLPELFTLRNLFVIRFGDVGHSSDSCVDQKFVDKLSSKDPSTNTKLKLMEEISEEFSLNWDSEAFRRKILNPSVSGCDLPPKHSPHQNRVAAFSHVQQNGMDDADLKSTNRKPKSSSKRHQNREDMSNSPSITGRTGPALNDRTKRTLPQEVRDVKPSYLSNALPPYTKPTVNKQDIKNETVNVVFNTEGEDGGIASKFEKSKLPGLHGADHEKNMEVPTRTNENGDMDNSNAPIYDRTPPKPRSVRRRPAMKSLTQDHKESSRDDDHIARTAMQHDRDENGVRNPEYEDGYHKEKENENNSRKERVRDEIQVRQEYEGGSRRGRSRDEIRLHQEYDDGSCRGRDRDERVHQEYDDGSRRGRNRDEIGVCEGHHDGSYRGRDRGEIRVLQKTKDGSHRERARDEISVPQEHGDGSRRDRHSRRSQRVQDEKRYTHVAHESNGHDIDDDEMMMDDLLILYSQKQPSSGAGRAKAREKTSTYRHDDVENSKSTRSKREDIPHHRTVSLPCEHVTADEEIRGPIRAVSMKPNFGVGHVHPNLPDYDELAARIAALRGK